MSLYYQDEHVTLYHGDCREITAWLDADVLVTDPPYGMAYAGFGGRKGEPRRSRDGHKIAGDDTTQIRDDAIVKWGGKPALVFGKWTIERPADTRARLIWDKRPCGFMGALNCPWGGVDEEIYVLGTGFVGKRSANILSFETYNSQAQDRPDHPTPKPVPLMEALLAKCPPGVVADPFAGSGATLRAAKNLGRKAIGVELEERYCEIIAKRLDQYALDFGSVS